MHFRPVDKADFKFKEGMYVSLNCPFIAENEWHPSRERRLSELGATRVRGHVRVASTRLELYLGPFFSSSLVLSLSEEEEEEEEERQLGKGICVEDMTARRFTISSACGNLANIPRVVAYFLARANRETSLRSRRRHGVSL